MQSRAMEAEPFEWNLPEAAPAGTQGAPGIFAAPKPTPRPTSEPPISPTDEPLGGKARDESFSDPVLHR